MAVKKSQTRGAATQNNDIPKIMLLLRIEISSGRQQLAGIFRYLKSGHAWNVRLLPPGEMTPEILETARQEGVRGIISSESGLSRVAALLPRSGLSAVALDANETLLADPRSRISFVRVDDVAIGRHAANHLLSCGTFRSFAFVPDRENRPWSQAREAAFRDSVQSAKVPYLVFPSTDFIGEFDDRRALRSWLLSLPKPAAVMAAYDVRAATILEICLDGGISIPDQLVLIGVDNDELYSDNLSPSLSSVEPNFEKEGFLAAQEMERLLHQRPPQTTRGPRSGRRAPAASACTRPSRHVVCPPLGVVERESTRAVAPAAHLVKEAVAFIRHNATKGIRVPDVVAHLRCSRRLADLRFRQFQGETIRHCIERIRLDEVKRRLRESDASLTHIARQCGFTSLKHLETTFRARIGSSLRAWRNDIRAT